MPKVSIIIPAYNQAQFLARAIETSLGQTYTDLEVVVVDDGSKDETPEVASRYLDRPNFKYIRQDNAGAAAARNHGFALSQGEYVSFLDSDDYYRPEKVARQVALLDADSDLGWAYCDVLTVDPEDRPLAEQYSILDSKRTLSGDLFGSLMLGGYFPPHVVLIRRAVLGQVGLWDGSFGGHMDYELWLRVAGAGFKAAFVPEVLAVYRSHPDSMSKDGFHMTESRLTTFQKMVLLHPSKVANGINLLQQANQDFFLANQWLSQQRGKPTVQHDDDEDAGAKAGRAYNFIRHFKSARYAKGKSDQLAIWEANIDGINARSIFLHPDAELAFTLPTGIRGVFETAVAIHPDAWDKPNASGCEFVLRVDGRVGLVMALNPACIPTDRHWFQIKIDLPANPTTHHEIILESRTYGRTRNFAWALWREPTFHWDEPIPA